MIDADPDAPEPWVASEYVPAPSLTTVVEDTGPLRPDAVADMAAGLAEALRVIHSAGLVHRDLKPSNVLMAANGPRVIDFGISHALSRPHLTRTGLVVGTPGYLSPEQATGADVGPASDVFSLGAVLAYAALGRHPFGDGNAVSPFQRDPTVLRPPLDGGRAGTWIPTG